MLSFFSNYYGGSEAAATALQAKIQVFTQLNVAALAAELTVSEGLQDKLEVLHNEIDATHIAILETRVELEEFKHINNNVNDLKAKVIEVLQRKHREDTLAELNRAFADIDMTADVAMLSEHKNFIRKWALERANVMKDCKVQNMANLSVSEVKKIYVIALINILKKPELKKIDSTREYHFKIVMRYIARNKTTTSTSKELMKLIHINLGAVMLEDSKNIGAYLNGKEDAPIQTDAKILLDSLRKVLSPGDVNYVLEFINKITQQFYFNDYQNLLARIAVVLANNPIKTVLTNVTTKEQADHDDYYKQLAEVDLLGVNNTYTVELVAKAIKLIFDGTENAGAAPFLAGLNLNLVNKIASIFIKSINPIKRLVDLQTIVTNATNLLQLHEYITNFIGPVADIQPGSYEELLAGNEFAMSPELKAHKPANIVKLAKALEIGKQQIANFVANQEQVMSQKINKNIDIYVANALINSVYRALQLSASPKNLEVNKIILEKLAKLVALQVTAPSLNSVIHFVISIFDQFENNWSRGADLRTNSVDIYLLQLLFNTGTPKGLFKSTLVEVQAAYPADRASKEVQMSKFPVSDLQGDMVLWLAAPASGNALRLNYQHCQMVREQAKLNLHCLHNLVQRFKLAAPVLVDANREAANEIPASDDRYRMIL